MEAMRLSVSLVQERFCAEHTIIRQSRAAEYYAVAAHKTIIADADRTGCLPILFNVDGVRNELRLESRHGGERADCDRVRAIEKMPMGNGRMLAHDQLGPTIGLAAEMPRVRARFLPGGHPGRRGLAFAQWKTGNPIAAPDGRVRF